MALVKRADKITERTTQRTYYADFQTEFDLIKFRDLQLDTNEKAVMQAIHNLVLTNPGERLYNPTLGCGIRSLLFENMTAHTQSLIREKIQIAIENFEPRARLIDIVTEMSPDDHSVYVAITFSIINKQEPITLEFVLTRIR